MSDASLIGRFEAQVAACPDGVAVADGDMVLTYAALAARVDRCADGLVAQGVAPGDRVGLLLPRSWQLVVATLALMKCGAVAVPLDKDSPAARLDPMIAAAGCELVIGVDGAHCDLATIIAVGQDAPFTAKLRKKDDPAFIFFTSGSTGTPKAVLVPERGVLRLAQDGYIPFGPGMRFGSISNPSFDAINFDIWAPLLTGGTCVIIPQDVATDFHALAEVLRVERVETIFLTVALFNAIVADVPQCFDNARTVLIGGERINTPTVLQWYEQNPDSPCTIHNVYGPTECATFSLSYPIPRDEVRADAPIGHPLPGTELHIDSAGELWIGGDAVALGYDGQPELTGAAFVDHNGARFYRTGDLVTQNADGTINYAGRLGRQVKVRGFRVEPGEIESVIGTHPEVAQAYVSAVRPADGPVQLHAYLRFRDAVTYDAFRDFLRDRLPSYMMPHRLFVMDSLPMTANGKVDQVALTALDLKPWRPARADAPVAPTVAPLLRIAAEVLDQDGLTPEDSFLDSGGDSLSALRFLHRLVVETGRSFDLADILACDFATLAGRGKAARAVDLPVQTRTQALATTEQKRLWLHAQSHPGSRAYTVPLIFHLTGNVDADRLAAVFSALYAVHPTFSTAFIDADDELWQVFRPRTGCSFHAYPTGRFTADSWREFAADFMAQPFDLAEPALCRACWLPFDDTQGVLLIQAHHIILDGWSLNLLLEELSQRYNDRDVPPHSATGMGRVADRMAERHASPEYAADRVALVGIWRDVPERDPPLPALQAKGGARARVIRQPLGHAAGRAVAQAAQRNGLTHYQVYLTLCSCAYAHVTGQKRFTLASPASNRADPATAQTIGMLANTVLVPVSLTPEDSLQDALRAQGQFTRNVLRLQEVALEHLLDDLAVAGLAGKARSDCMFVMENTDYGTLALDGVQARFDLPDTVDAKTPLLVVLQQSEDGPELVVEAQNSHFTADDSARFVAAVTRGIALLENAQATVRDISAPLDLRGPVLSLPKESIADMLLAQAQATPDRIALQEADDTLTYAELMARAGAAAAAISARVSAEPCTVVGLHMRPGIDHIVALTALACLNITIVPLDPDYPQAMLDDIVAQADPALILGETAPIAGHAVTSLDLTCAATAPKPQHHGNPLYLLFTSGSTGRPKGVRVYDDTISNLLHWQRAEGRLDTPARTQQFSKLSFDVSFQEILTTLTNGGTLDLLTPDLRHDTEALLRQMRERGCERIFLPFIALKLLAETALATGIRLPALKQVISAGEALICTRDLRAWFKTMPQARLINHYGPSETHVVSAHHLPDDPDDWPDTAPIGRPIGNVSFAISDDDELLIGGDYVRPCYLNPADNAARFLPGPQVRYRSGDRVSVLRNDRLSYLGRIDNQVKFSGHRLELSQVEAVIGKLAEVSLCVVRLIDDRLTGFVEWAGPARLSAEALNAHLANDLPAHVRLHGVQSVTHWPRTPSGKLDRRALVAQTPAATAQPATNDTVLALSDLFTAVLGRPIAPDQSFTAAGANSLDLMRFRNACQRQFNRPIAVADLFGAATTIRKLAALLGATDTAATAQAPATPTQDKIAIVGMAVDLPGASDLDAFAEMILQNRSGITYFDAAPGKVGARSEMTAPLGFDPRHFGISPQEAVLMDPQQRHLLMGAVHVLQDAGVDPARSHDRIGIIASSGENTYFQQMLLHGDPDALPDSFQMALHHDKDFLATKLAYRLGLTGPALTVQAACGSSLIGVHMAAGMLRQGDCDAMIVAASLVDITLHDGYTYRPQHIFSRDGTCRPFDKDASGTIGASGRAAVMLKPLEAALRDGNRIHAVLEGSAINNDGLDKMSYTAPSATGQREALAAALAQSGLAADDVGYIEAHGTGTILGDPVEVGAIHAVYGDRSTPLILSSVKSQIGHMGAAAGLVGLIRVALAMRLQVYPPNLHFREPNPELGLDDKMIEVPATARPWLTAPRRAGVSSFGIGGTNAHAILSEAPKASQSVPVGADMLVISASSEISLKRWAAGIADYLENYPNRAPQVLRFLQHGTPRHALRAGFAWKGVADAVRRLRALDINGADEADGSPVQTERPAPPPEGFPLYPFDCSDCVFAQRAPDATTLRRLPPEQWLSQPLWAPLGPVVPRDDAAAGTALLLCDAAYELPPLPPYARFIRLELGQAFAKLGPDHFAITQETRDFGALLQELVAGPVDILNLLPLGLPDGVNAAGLTATQIACLDVIPALVSLARAAGESVRLIHVSRARAVLAGLLAGSTHVVPTEQGIASHWLELEPDQIDLLGHALWPGELPEGRSALWQGQLWNQAKAPVPPRPTRPMQEAKHYVVIGGTGGIGRNISQQLLDGTKNRVTIVSRAPTMPPELMAYADRITLQAHDLTCAETPWPDFATKVDGIIMTAGQGSYMPIPQRDPMLAAQGSATRLNGALSVENLIGREKPEIVIYCSSMAAQMGGRGQLDYAASNGLLDALAHWINPASPATRRIVINWDIWAESGMAVDAMAQDAAHQAHLRYGLSDAEGRATFARALGMGLPQVLVSTVPLADATAFYGASNATAEPGPAGSVEDRIAAMVGNLLGLSEVDVGASLDALGLDSIAMIDLLEQVGTQFADAPTLSAITGEMTVRDLAGLLSVEDWSISALAEMIVAATGVAKILPDDRFDVIGVDSLCAIDLIERITAARGVTLTLSDFGDDQTPAGLFARIADGVPAAKVIVDRWQKGSGRRAICFIHPVGGETAVYKPLLRMVGPDVTVLAIADPHLSGTARGLTTIRDRATQFLAALSDIDLRQLDLVGWSFGAWVAQEMAVQAQEQGTPLASLTMIDPPEPDCGSRLGHHSDTEIQTAFLHELMPRLGAGGARPLDARIAPELQNHLDRLVQCCALNMEAMRHHAPRDLRDTPTRLYIADRAAEGLLLAPIDATAHLAKWQSLIGLLKEARIVAADHYTIMQEPVIGDIMRALRTTAAIQ